MDCLINNLSDDVLLEVFEFLDAGTLKKAALVCKNWNDVISLSPSTMKKFTLKLSNNENSMWVDHFDELMNLERKFQAMSVFLHSSRYKQSVDLLIQASSRYGSQIRSLTLYDSEFESLSDFTELMRSFPLLEELSIIKTTLKPSKTEEPQIIPVELKRLRHLNVNSCNWKFFQCLIGSQIFSLSISSKMGLITNRDSLVNFLEASKNLEVIEVDSRTYVRLFEIPFRQELPFKPKRIKFLWHFPSFDVNEADFSFNKFLLSHAKTLEVLELNYVSRDQLRTIFNKFIALKKLRVNATSLPNEKEFFDQLNPLKSLKELVAHDKIPNEDAARGVLGNCPNLEKLFMIHDPDNMTPTLLPFIALHNPKLKYLSIETLKAPVDAKFKFLKFLHLDMLDNIDHLKSFLTINPSIDTLSIQWHQNPSESVVEELLNEPNLKHLKFTGNFAVLKAIFDKIKVDYKKMKTLELNVEYEETKEKRSLSFIFPEDFNSWNQKCEFFDEK